MEHSEESASQDHAQSTVGLTTPSAKAVGPDFDIAPGIGEAPWAISPLHPFIIYSPSDHRVIARVEAGPVDKHAAFIVRACNSHYQLLSALKAALPALDEPNFQGEILEVIAQVREAISVAEGEEA